MAIRTDHDEVMGLMEAHSLMGKDLGYIDMHLLASALLTDVPLWTLARKLDETASKLKKKHFSSRL